MIAFVLRMIILLGVAAVAYAPRLSPPLIRLNVAVILPVLGWTIWLWWRLRQPGAYRSEFAWLNPEPSRRSPTPCSRLHFSRAAGSSSLVVPWMPGSMDSASLLDEAAKVLLLLTVGAISTYATSWYAGILRRALNAQVRRSAEERDSRPDFKRPTSSRPSAPLRRRRFTRCATRSRRSIFRPSSSSTRSWTPASGRMSSAFRAKHAARTPSSKTFCASPGPPVRNEAPSHVSLPAVIDAALTSTGPLLCDQHVTVSSAIDVPDDPPPSLQGSGAALQRAALNLVGNAVQAMEGQPQDKEIKLVVSGSTVTGSLSLLIADSGPGFTSESSARAFERFFTTKPPGKGTGLGLWIVRETVAAFGGSVSVEPHSGRGARIRLCSPSTPRQRQSRSGPPGAGSGIHARRSVAATPRPQGRPRKDNKVAPIAPCQRKYWRCDRHPRILTCGLRRGR